MPARVQTEDGDTAQFPEPDENVNDDIVTIERVLQRMWLNTPGDTMYFKSAKIAKRTDFSSKKVGSHINTVIERENGMQIEKWGESSGSTWELTITDNVVLIDQTDDQESDIDSELSSAKVSAD